MTDEQAERLIAAMERIADRLAVFDEHLAQIADDFGGVVGGDAAGYAFVRTREKPEGSR